MKRPNRLDETAIEDRRRKVAQLYLRRQTQEAIAQSLGVTQATISMDLAELRKQWAAQSVDALDEVKVREAAELDEMESEAAVEFSKRKNWEWFDRRLKVKERRARLLGLDAPTKTDANVNIGKLSDEELKSATKAALAGNGPAGADLRGESGGS